MKRKRVTGILALSVFGVMALTGCATSTQTGAGGGPGDTGLRAVIGRAIGTIRGALSAPQLERSRAEVVASNRYTPNHGNRLIVEGVEVIPEVARPGDEIRVKVRYSVLAPDPQAMIPVTETWLFKLKNQPLGEPIRKPLQYKAQGGHSSTYKFTVTSDFSPGTYHVFVTISNGTTSQSVGKSFSI